MEQKDKVGEMDAALQVILTLLREKGISDIAFCKALGINKSAVTDWRKGKTASYKKHIPAIAGYLGVTEEYIRNGGNTERVIQGTARNTSMSVTAYKSSYSAKGNVPVCKAVRVVREPTDEEIKFALFGGDGEITDEMYEDVKRYAQFIREKKKRAKENGTV